MGTILLPEYHRGTYRGKLLRNACISSRADNNMVAMANVTALRCGREQPSATECAPCGVLFAKHRAEPARPDPVFVTARPSARPSPRSGGGGLTLGRLVFLVAAGLVAVIVLKDGR